MKIGLLGAATALSLGVGAAYADVGATYANNEGNANPQIILEAAPTALPQVTPAPMTPGVPVAPRTKGWQQDGQVILLY
jgi:cytochrome c551/c552